MSEKKAIQAIIIDDSKQARKLLRLMLLELATNVQIVGEAENFDEGLKMVEDLLPDAIFLDIEMPGKNGIQLATTLFERKIPVNVVFTTAYNSYAINAFRLSAVDYLLKPIQEDQLEEAVAKLADEKKNRDNDNKLKALATNLNENQANVLCIPVQSGYEYIPVKDIVFLEADGSYVRIVLEDKKTMVVSKNLKYFEKALAGIPHFIRTHRSFIVNINEVISFSKTNGASLQLRTGNVIPIARERRQVVQSYLT